MSGLLDNLANLSGGWTYAVIGLLAAAEAAAFVGLFLPGELAMLFAGFLTSTGRVNLGWMLLAAAVGAVAGDSVGYEIGRRFGPALRSSRLGRRIGQQRWDRAERYVAAHGARAVFLGRFVGLLRALVPTIAGSSRMPYRTFLLYNAAGGLIWAPGFVLLGYAAGGSYQRVARVAEQAGLVVLALAVLIGGVVVAARWAATHPDRIRAWLDRQLSRPFVRGLARRYDRQLDWLTHRLDPRGAAGLSLTAGLVVLVGFGWMFGAVLEDVVGREELATVDSPVTSWLADHRVSWLTPVMRAMTTLGGTATIAPLLLTVAAVALVRTRRWDTPAFLLAVAAGTSTLVTVIKLLAARTRPDIGYAIGVLDGTAFPSGHSAQTVASYGALAHLATRHTLRWSQRVSVWAAVAVLALLVGFSRIYLGAHWLTDVLGGWTLGAAWLATVITATTTRQRLHRHAADTTQPDLTR